MSQEGSGLTPWEYEQLAYIPEVRKRLRVELDEIYRCGASIVDAFAKHTTLFIHVLSYAWRDTNALMRTCKRFYEITQTRQYWKALASYYFAQHVPPSILCTIDWFYGLADSEPAYSYLWSCVSTKERGNPPPLQKGANGFYLIHFYGDTFLEAVRYALHIRWNIQEEWHSIGQFTVHSLIDDFYVTALTYVRVVYFNHPLWRRRIFIEDSERYLSKDYTPVSDLDERCIINCYVELWDTSRNAVWHGEPRVVAQQGDDETLAMTGVRTDQWGAWIESKK